jgi:hypothetical protein
VPFDHPQCIRMFLEKIRNMFFDVVNTVNSSIPSRSQVMPSVMRSLLLERSFTFGLEQHLDVCQRHRNRDGDFPIPSLNLVSDPALHVSSSQHPSHRSRHNRVQGPDQDAGVGRKQVDGDPPTVLG